MILWSLVAGMIGILGAWFGMTRLDRGESPHPPEVFWVLGLAALSPAWLIAVWGLLDRTSGRFPDVAVAAWWIISGAAALLGVLLTDAMVRRLRESGRPYPRARYWLVGVGALFPAWCIALLGLLWTSTEAALTVSAIVAAGAGLLSFLPPCVLPLGGG